MALHLAKWQWRLRAGISLFCNSGNGRPSPRAPVSRQGKLRYRRGLSGSWEWILAHAACPAANRPRLAPLQISLLVLAAFRALQTEHAESAKIFETHTRKPYGPEGGARGGARQQVQQEVELRHAADARRGPAADGCARAHLPAVREGAKRGPEHLRRAAAAGLRSEHALK